MAGRFSVGHSCRRQSSWSLHARPDLPVANRSVPPIRRLAREEPATGFCDCSTRRRLAELPGFLEWSAARRAPPRGDADAGVHRHPGRVDRPRPASAKSIRRDADGWRVAGGGWAGGYFASDWVELRAQSTGPILRVGGFLLGPVGGLVLLSFLKHGHGGERHLVSREAVIAAFLLASALNFGVACGQAFIPGFPIPTLYDPVSGFFHNPVGLAQLMTLAAPVALAVSLHPIRIGWLRPLAVVTLALIGVLFLPIGQRSAHLGVATGLACMLTATGFRVARSNKVALSRHLVVTGIVGVLLVVGLAGAFARTGQWREVGTAISKAPLSTAWLGIGLRRETNRMAFFMVGDRPFGGYGIGGFEAALPAYYERYGPLERQYDHALLNHPLHMLVDLGVLGLAANLWLLGAFFVPPLWAVFAGTRSAERQAAGDLLALGCVVAVGAALFLSLWTAEWLYDAPINVPAFMLLALAASTCTTADGTPRRTRGWTILALPLGHTVMFLLGI